MFAVARAVDRHSDADVVATIQSSLLRAAAWFVVRLALTCLPSTAARLARVGECYWSILKLRRLAAKERQVTTGESADSVTEIDALQPSPRS